MSLVVLKGGLLTSVQDLGRSGYQAYGVAVGGAADSFAARVANALVGNPGNAAVLEIALVGPELQFGSETLLAWCGAEFEAQLDGRGVPPNRPIRATAGAVVSFGMARTGARAWLAVAGGIDVPLVLGSRSTSRRFGFGGLDGRALMEGDQLRFGLPTGWARQICASLRSTGQDYCDWSVRPAALGQAGGSDRLRALRGPEWDWFGPEAQALFFSASYRVTKDADRMGVRLEGPSLRLNEPREMISSAVNQGNVQVQQGGQPIILLCSRQTIGGYPRMAAIATIDAPKLAQLKQGDLVRFDAIALREAHKLALDRERDFFLACEELSRRTA